MHAYVWEQLGFPDPTPELLNPKLYACLRTIRLNSHPWAAVGVTEI